MMCLWYNRETSGFQINTGCCCRRDGGLVYVARKHNGGGGRSKLRETTNWPFKIGAALQQHKKKYQLKP